MHRLGKTTFLILCTALASPAAESEAQAPELPGRYTYVAEGSDDINQAIQQAIQGMSFVLRPVARSRLRRTNHPYTSIAIASSGSEVVIELEGRSIASPASGEEVQWRREDGEILRVATRWRGASLEQRFTADDGERINLFTLDPDGTMLTLLATITSPRLPAPVVYRLRYRRQI